VAARLIAPRLPCADQGCQVGFILPRPATANGTGHCLRGAPAQQCRPAL